MFLVNIKKIMAKYNQIVFTHLPHTMKGGLPIIDERNKKALSSFSDKIYDCSYHPFGERKQNIFKAIFYKIRLLCGIELRTSKQQLFYSYIHNDKSLLFFSHSFYGVQIKNIKKCFPSCIVISFFHNVESEYCKQLLKTHFTLSLLYRYLLFRKIEKYTIRYSDRLIVLNQRDHLLLEKIYGCNKSYLFPTTILDRFQVCFKKKINIDKPLTLLFVGTLFPSNEQGVLWLAKNISPYIKSRINIVGLHMDNIAPQLVAFPNISVVGEVSTEELDQYYYNADVFISTLFIGGGMKTKIAEAMMFALPIIGTEEAFQGYDINHSKIGLKSDNPSDIVSFINKLDSNRELLRLYSQNSRSIYLEKYSGESSYHYMEELLNID